MNEHDIANIIVVLEGKFMRIKTISTCGEIDRICCEGISKLVDLGILFKAEEQIKIVKERLVDPMA